MREWGSREAWGVVGEIEAGPAQASGRQGGLVYLSVHDDVNSDPVGFDECAGGGTVYFVILGEPRAE